MRYSLLLATAVLGGALHAQWNSVPSGTLTMLEAVHIIDSQRIMACGKDGVLIHSTNAGTSWAPLPSGYGDDLNEILQLDASTFLIMADGGVVLRSTNGGASWSMNSTPTGAELTGAARSGDSFVAVGESGAVLRSTDAGLNWTSAVSGSINDLLAVWPMGGGTWVAVGKSGTAIRSTDDGASWTPMLVPATADLNDVRFLSPTTGLICGDEGTMLRTTDGGANWVSAVSGTGNELDGLWSTDPDNAYVSGVGGTVRRSTDAGLTWTLMTTPVVTELRDLALGNGLGFAVGDAGTIIRLSQGTTGLSVPDFTAGISMSPIPAGEEVLLNVVDERLRTALTAEVIDARGIVIRRTGAIGQFAHFHGLSSGTYTLRLSRDGVPVHARSFVVAR